LGTDVGISKDKLQEAWSEFIEQVPDELLPFLALGGAAPWQYSPSTGTYEDPDFGRVTISGAEKEPLDRSALQAECWNKAIENPQINTSVRGLAGRLTGFGFEIGSSILEIEEALREIIYDPRNRLYLYFPKFVVRAIIEGELFLCLTVHSDGFIEVDFIDPQNINGGNEYGIIFHPNKANLPLFYFVTGSDGYLTDLIPSIFIARYPELLEVAKKNVHFSEKLTEKSRKSGSKFKKLGGFNRFIVAWDRGFITKRNVSHLRTTLKWINLYENLKYYEVDHKKSAGAYLWKVVIEDLKVFKYWLSLSDEERRKTGIGGKKTPGSTIVLPKGMDIQAVNPTLPRISDSDTDILQMVQSGLNEPQDVTMGSTKMPFAAISASRGPMSDRVADEASAFEYFLRYDFWGSIFYLKSVVSGFPRTIKVKKAVGFEKKPDGTKKAKFKRVERFPEELIEISFPTSEIEDLESRARALLGVKHGSTADVLGIPHSVIARKLGFGNYRKLRLKHAEEAEELPQLIANVDQEMFQEKREAEPSPRKLPRGDADQGGK